MPSLEAILKGLAIAVCSSLLVLPFARGVKQFIIAFGCVSLALSQLVVYGETYLRFPKILSYLGFFDYLIVLIQWAVASLVASLAMLFVHRLTESRLAAAK
ncbi:MAG: hypothetical protein ACAH95_02465 [Fimbriimonas sp.]